MNLVVTVLVRNDLDVIAAWIEYYRAQGASAIIVTDNGSEDGTVAVLEQYAAAGAIRLLHEPGDDYRQAEWVTRMARLAAAEYRADWVINADSDEFWRVSRAGTTLAEALEALPATTVAVRAERHDLRGRGGASTGWFRRLRWLDRRTVSERGTPLASKLAHRATDAVQVLMGNHGIEGLSGDIDGSGLLEIAHLPSRSWLQYERKIRLGGAAIARNPDHGPETAWHWRAEYERLRSGELEARYRGFTPTVGMLARGLLSGRFERERRLHRELRALRATALRPELLEASLRA